MKKFRYLTMILVGALSMAACVKEKYTPNSTPEGTQVYFATDTRTEYTSSIELTSIEVSLNRVVTDEAMDVVVEVSDTSGLFTTATEMTAAFAEGSDAASVTIPVNHSSLAAGRKYAVTLKIADETTPYAKSELKLVVTCPEPWVYLGESIFSDNIIAGYYTAPEVGKQWAVKTYSNSNFPGTYFFLNAFTSTYPNKEKGDYVEDDVYFQVKVEDNGNVWIPYQSLGCDWGDGLFRVVSYISRYFNGLDDDANYGYIDANNVIRFEPKTILISEDNYNDGGFSYTNADGKFFIALPGAVLIDFAVEVAYDGRTIDTEDVEYANGSVEVDEAVPYVKVAMFEGKYGASKLNKLLADEVEALTLENGGKFSFELEDPTPGTYCFIAVSYNENDEPQESNYVEFTYTAHGGVVPEPEEPFAFKESYSLYGKFVAGGQLYNIPCATGVQIIEETQEGYNVVIKNFLDPSLLSTNFGVTGVSINYKVPAYFDEESKSLSIERYWTVGTLAAPANIANQVGIPTGTALKILTYVEDAESAEFEYVDADSLQSWVDYEGALQFAFTYGTQLLGYFPMASENYSITENAASAAKFGKRPVGSGVLAPAELVILDIPIPLTKAIKN